MGWSVYHTAIKVGNSNRGTISFSHNTINQLWSSTSYFFKPAVPNERKFAFSSSDRETKEKTECNAINLH